MINNLTNYEYITLKLSFPTINTSNLVKIPSRIKTPNVIELMELHNSQIFTIQQEELRLLTNKIIVNIKSNKNSDELFLEKKNILQKHLKLCSYFLLPGHFIWSKLEP